MAGRSQSTKPTKLDGVNVQSSVYGSVVNTGWGTNRVSAKLLDLEDFHAKAKKANTGGKGGGSTITSYTYDAAIMMLVSKGPILGISKVWRDKSRFIDGSTTALAQASLSVALGSVGQSPWGYMTTHHPTKALGYSEFAYVYASAYPLGTTGGVPNHSFEVKWTEHVSGLPDANAANILTDFLTHDVHGWPSGLIASLTDYSNYCLAANLLISPNLDTQAPAREFIDDMMLATNSSIYWSEGLVKVVPRGDTTVTANGVTWNPSLDPEYDLTLDQFTAGDAPISKDIVDQADAYNVVSVEFLNRANDYNPEPMPARDLANIEQYGRRQQDPTTLHMICDPVIARNIAQIILQRVLYVRGKFYFELPWEFARLEQTDLVTLTCAQMGMFRVLVRLIQIDDQEASAGMGRRCVAEEMLVGNAHAPIYGTQASAGYTPNYDADPGEIENNLLTWSQDFDSADWINFNVTVTPFATTAPDGTSTGSLLVPTVTNGVHVLEQGKAAVPGYPYVYSQYLKAAGYANVELKVTGSGGGFAMVVDCSAGTVTSTSTTGSGTISAYGVDSVGSGWYRFWIAGTSPGSAILFPQCSLLSSGGASSWSGNGSSGMYSWGASLAPGSALSTYVRSYFRAAVPYIFNPPSVLTSDGRQTWAAVAGLNSNWGGANVWISLDGTNYQMVGEIDARGRYGAITNDLPLTSDPDSSSLLGVDINASGGALETATVADADGLATLFLLGSELFAYETATLFAAGEYYLSYLRRVGLGTAMGSHTHGDPFVRLDETVFKFPFLSAVAGGSVYVKFQSFNIYGRAVRDLATCAVYTTTPDSVAPPAPSTGDWSVMGTTFTQGGYSIPSLVITGRCSRPDVTDMQFYFRVHGLSVWTATGGQVPPNFVDGDRIEIPGVTSTTEYDVGVAYIVGGVTGPILFIGSATVGTVVTPPAGGGGGGTGPVVGNVILNDPSPGARSFTIPDTVTEIRLDRWGAGGAGGGQSNIGTDKEPNWVPNYGGGGGEYVGDTLTVTPGDVISYRVGGYYYPAINGDTSVSAPSLSTAHGGGTGDDSSGGTGGTGGSGDFQADGADGGSPSAPDGGAPGNSAASGAYGYGGAGGADPTPATGLVKITVTAVSP